MTGNNDEINFEKIKYLDIQLIAITGFIISLLISFFLTYDKKLSIKENKKLFDDKTSQNLALFQNILVFVIAICFLYINYKQYELAKKVNDKDEEDLYLGIETSVLGIISALVGIYIIYKNYKNGTLQIAETEVF